MPIARPALDGKVLFDRSATELITRTVLRSGHLTEVGGLLLGFRRGHHLHVKFATVPAAGDSSQTFRFVRRGFSHQLFAYKAWVTSGFRCDWIGEWHTHPEPVPVPSVVDLATWRSQVAKTKKPMAYLIVGTSSIWTGVLRSESSIPDKLQMTESHADTVLYSKS